MKLTHWKRHWCWEGLGAGEEGDDRGWDGWMASPTQWTWVWVNSGSWWWTGRPGVLWFMGSQSRTWLSDWTELNLNPVIGVLITRSWRQRDTHGEEHHVKTKTKIGMISLQVKEFPELPATTRSWKTGKADSPLGLPEGSNPADILISDFRFRNWDRSNLWHLKPPYHGMFFMAVLGN